MHLPTIICRLRHTHWLSSVSLTAFSKSYLSKRHITGVYNYYLTLNTVASFYSMKPHTKNSQWWNHVFLTSLMRGQYWQVANVGAEEYFSDQAKKKPPKFDKVLLKDAVLFFDNPRLAYTNIMQTLKRYGKVCTVYVSVRECMLARVPNRGWLSACVCVRAFVFRAVQRKKLKKSENTMEVGGWVQVTLGFFLWKINHPKIALNQYRYFGVVYHYVFCLYIHC